MAIERLRVATIVGTRPEIIKLSSTIKACQRYFDHILVHTGQNWDYALNEVFFKDFGLEKPDHFLDCAGDNLGETIGNIVARSYAVLEQTMPDAVLVLGDTNSALSAIAAKRLKIPIFHMEAGNRCFDENLPEEINRRIVDHVSDVNLPYTEHARRYLLAEGVRKEHIFVTGSPMAEILADSMERIRTSSILETLELERDRYIVVSAHREENVDEDETFGSLMAAINDVAEMYGLPIVFSTHPRTLNRLKARSLKPHALVQHLQPFGFFDYNRLQLDAFSVLSDSGTLAEESAILGFSGVSLRTSTERPETLDKGSFIIGGTNTRDIVQAIELAREMKAHGDGAVIADDYRDTNVSSKVVKIIQSYTQIVNRVVWRKR